MFNEQKVLRGANVSYTKVSILFSDDKQRGQNISAKNHGAQRGKKAPCKPFRNSNQSTGNQVRHSTSQQSTNQEKWRYPQIVPKLMGIATFR